MPVEINKEVTSTNTSLNGGQTSQTATSAQVSTPTEHQDAQSDRGNAWIWYIVGIVDILILLRILFHLFGARAAGFTNFIYGITGPFVAPFRGIFTNPRVEGSYFDTAAFIAIIIYILLGWMIVGLINLATRPTDSKNI